MKKPGDKSEIKKIIVTRHPALAEYIKEIGLVPEDTPTYVHVTNYEIKDTHVFGIVPLNLALLAKRITIVPFGPGRNLKNKEMSIEYIREIVGTPRTYEIKEIETQYHLTTLS